MILLSEKDIKLHNLSATFDLPLFWYGKRLFRSYIPSEECRFKKILSLNIPEIQTAT
jgi:hypothetical protein